MDDDAPALVRLLQGTVASVQFMAENAPFFSLLEVEGRNVSDVLRQGTEQHVSDVTALILEGQADGTVTDDDPADLLALGGRRHRRPVQPLPPHGAHRPLARRAVELRRPPGGPHADRRTSRSPVARSQALRRPGSRRWRGAANRPGTASPRADPV